MFLPKADAVCRQLGFRYATDFYSDSRFGVDDTYPSFTDVICNDNRQYLRECLLRRDSYVNPRHIVGVTCFDASRPSTTTTARTTTAWPTTTTTYPHSETEFGCKYLHILLFLVS